MAGAVMSDGLGTLGVAAIPVSCLVYIFWSAARRGRANRLGLRDPRAAVRFHAIWGMVLSLPLVVGGAASSFGQSAHWLGTLTLASVLGCWAVATVALLGRPVTPVLTWLPLVVVTATVALLPSGSDSWHAFIFWLFIYSLGGVGLTAWVLVSVNFAISVRRVANDRELNAKSAED